MRSALLLAALACATGACGVGGVLAGSSGGGGGGSSTPREPPASVSIAVASAVDVDGRLTARGYVRIEVQLIDAAIRRAGKVRPPGALDPRVRIYPEFTTDASSEDAWVPMTEVGLGTSSGTRALPLGRHGFEWDTLADIGGRRREYTIRVRAEYEDGAGRKKRFRSESRSIVINNLVGSTVLGGEIQEALDFDTLPEDIAADGDGFLVASSGANIVERVDAAGRIERFLGVGIAGDNVRTGGEPGVARVPAMTGIAVAGQETVVASHAGFLSVTNRSTVDVSFGGTPAAAGRVSRFADGRSGARAVRRHSSGALLWIETQEGAARVVAFNPQDPGDPLTESVELAGVTIAPGATAVVAGGGSSLEDGVAALDADLSAANALAIGPDGEFYVVEAERWQVRVINATESPLSLPLGEILPGTVVTVAGGLGFGRSGDGGNALEARFEVLTAVAVTPQRHLLVVDAQDVGPRVRLVNLGVSVAEFAGETVDPGSLTTVVGGGAGAAGSTARELGLIAPRALAVDADGNLLVSSDSTVIVVNPGPESIERYGRRVASGRTAIVYDALRRGGLPLQRPEAAHLPNALAQHMFVTDATTLRVLNLGRKPLVFGDAVTAPGRSAAIAGGAIAGFAGDGGPARDAALSEPGALAMSPAAPGEDEHPLVFLADTGNGRVRVVHVGDPALAAPQSVFGVDIEAGHIDTVAGGREGPLLADGDGLGPLEANLLRPRGVAILRIADRDVLLISDSGHHRIRAVNPGPGDVVLAGVTVAEGRIETIIGDGFPGFTDDGPGPWRIDSPGQLLTFGELLLFAETGNARIRGIQLGTASARLARIDLPPGEIHTLVGTGTRGSAGDGDVGPNVDIDTPGGLFLQTRTSLPLALYFTDSAEHNIRVLNLTEDEDLDVAVDNDGAVVARFGPGTVYTVAGGPNRVGVPNTPGFEGDGELPQEMRFAAPSGVVWATRDLRGLHLIVCDRDNNRIRFCGPPPTRASFIGP